MVNPRHSGPRQTSADLYDDAPCAAPATANGADVLQVLRLPRKMLRLPRKRQTSADHDGAPSAAPATQNGADVLHVLRLPRKMQLMCSKCCACHAKAGGAQGTQDVARLPLTSMR